MLLACSVGRKDRPRTVPIDPDTGLEFPEGTQPTAELFAVSKELMNQLALGNLDSFRDGLFDEGPVFLFGPLASQMFIGEVDDEETIEHRPVQRLGRSVFRQHQLWMNAEGTMALAFSDVSLRYEAEGREALVPCQVSQFFVRRAGRWMLLVNNMGVPFSPLDEKSTGATADGDGASRGIPEEAVELIDAVLKGTISTERLSQDAVVVMPGVDGLVLPANGEFRPIWKFLKPEGEGSVEAKVKWLGGDQELLWAMAFISVRLQPEPGIPEKTIYARGMFGFRKGKDGAMTMVLAHVVVPRSRGEMLRATFGRGASALSHLP